MKRMTALCGALVLTLVMAAPAAAQKPEVLWEGPYTEPPMFIAECDGFDAMYRAEGYEKETFYYAGKMGKTIYRNQGTGYLYSSTDPTNAVSGKHAFQCHVTIVEHEPELKYYRDCSGTFLNIKAPGFGTIGHIAGHSEEWVVGPPGAEGVVLKDVGSEHFKADVCEVLAD